VSDVPADADRVLADLAELAELTSDANGAQRLTWTAPWSEARKWLTSKLAELPVEVDVDEASNLWATLQGRDERALIVGSHIDSVPGGGRFDGALGVVAGLEVLRRLSADGPPAVSVKLVDFAEEEGDQSGMSLFGSAAAAGTLEVELLQANTSYDGRPALEVLREAGVALEVIDRARTRLEGAVAFVELHIEQSTRLEHAGAAVAAVTGTAGVDRHHIRFAGRRDHPARPMGERADSLVAAARFLTELRALAQEHDASTLCGHLVVEPNIPLVVADGCGLTFDIRSFDTAQLATMETAWRELADRVCAAERTTWTSEPRWRIEPAAFDEELVQLAAEAIEELTGAPAPRLGSPQLHDAGEMARAGIPTVMLFVQSVAGISHSKDEFSHPGHLRLGIQALDRVVSKTLARFDGAQPQPSNPLLKRAL